MAVVFGEYVVWVAVLDGDGGSGCEVPCPAEPEGLEDGAVLAPRKEFADGVEGLGVDVAEAACDPCLECWLPAWAVDNLDGLGVFLSGVFERVGSLCHWSALCCPFRVLLVGTRKVGHASDGAVAFGHALDSLDIVRDFAWTCFGHFGQVSATRPTAL